jgi:amino acid transporter
MPNPWVRKSIAALKAEAAASEEHGLQRTLTGTNLILLGIGAVIGAGFFGLTGEASAKYAGPAISLSFILGGIVCAFAGLCYAEMASTVPIAGSAYTYAYATMGEFIAWLIGWDLILEYMVGATTVAIGWSGYVVSALHGFGIDVPPRNRQHRFLGVPPGHGAVQRSGHADRLPGHDLARHRHPGVGPGQHRHRLRQGGDPGPPDRPRPAAGRQ